MSVAEKLGDEFWEKAGTNSIELFDSRGEVDNS
jgi:hypothetical protein